MPNIFDYAVREFRPAYNIKWTILMHLRHIVNRNKIFVDLYPDGLDENHFFDSLSSEYKILPAFGVDYLGKRVVSADVEDLFMVRYVGRAIDIIPLNRYGIASENRRLLAVHDDIFHNFQWLSKDNKLRIYKFRDDTLDPIISNIAFTMDLLDSIPSRDEATHTRVNSLEMTFSSKINQ